MSKRVQEPVDQWLAKEGYFRKSTPRDPTCLFRAISEQVYLTQHYHLRVRKECTEFMAKKSHLFKDFVPIPFDYYLKEMQCFTEWGGMNEIRAISLLYKRDIIVFIGEKQICENVTNNGFKKGVLLLCHTELKQYDPVYPMAFVQSAAYCQSIVYEVVYKYMYRIPNIKTVADKMLNSRAPPALRHDRFFQRGNLDIREQLIEDLYKKVNNEHNTDEVQSDWKGAPPIPYKVARALAPDYYRNIELDIWHELKREVKYAGWNRYNSNELQIGGKCVIQISINDLEQSDKNNNKSVSSNLSQCSNSEINNKIEQQKLKQGPIWLHGYIQDMSTEKEPVLVFIKDLGEKKLVPYDALKPLPLVKKNRPKTWAPINKNPSVISDSNRRWKKSYNTLSQKKKDTLTITSELPNNTNKNVSINNNDVDNADINNINKIDFNEHDDKLPYVSVENSSICATNEDSDSLPVTTLDNSQSTVSSNVTQEITRERKKPNTPFKRVNNNMRNKSEKSKNFDNTLQNSNSKSKVLNKNYGLPYNGNLRTNICDNLNVSYVAPDNIYPYYPYMPGNFSVTSEHNQIDQTFALNLDYNLRHLEDTFCTLNPTYYGPLVYGPSHQGMRSIGAPLNAPVPYGQEEIGLINDMQNCSLTYNEGESASGENSNTSRLNTNSMPNIKQSKQGSKNSNGKDSLYSIQQKGKQSEIVKVNKIRNRQQNTRCGTAYMQYPGNQYSVSNGSTNDARKSDIHTLQLKQHWDPPQMTPVVPGLGHGYAPPQYATSTPIFPYQEFPPHYVSEGGYGSMAYLLPQHVDAENGTAPPPYQQHFYSTTEGYPPGHSSTNNQPMIFSQPLVYPQSMQYHAVPLPLPHIPEQWNPPLGPQPPYIPQCITPTPAATSIPGLAPIVEPPPNGQCAIPKSSA